MLWVCCGCVMLTCCVVLFYVMLNLCDVDVGDTLWYVMLAQCVTYVVIYCVMLWLKGKTDVMICVVMTCVMVCFLGLDDWLASKGEKSQQGGEDLTEQRAINQTTWAEWNLLCYDMWHNKNNILWYVMLICVVTFCWYVEVSNMLWCVTYVCYDMLCYVMLMIWCVMLWCAVLCGIAVICHGKLSWYMRWVYMICWYMLRYYTIWYGMICYVDMCYVMCCTSTYVLLWHATLLRKPYLTTRISAERKHDSTNNCRFMDRWTLDSEFCKVQNECQYKSFAIVLFT